MSRSVRGGLVGSGIGVAISGLFWVGLLTLLGLSLTLLLVCGGMANLMSVNNAAWPQFLQDILLAWWELMGGFTVRAGGVGLVLTALLLVGFGMAGAALGWWRQQRIGGDETR